MTAVPITHRRRFVAGCAIGWLGVAVAVLAAALVYPGPPYRAVLLIGLVLVILMLLATRRWEGRLRKTFLPPIGQIPWAFRFSVMGAVVMSFLVCMTGRLRYYIPGAVVTRLSGSIRCAVEGSGAPAPLECGFAETGRSGIIKWSRGVQSTETLTSFRLHPLDRPAEAGWQVLPEQNKLVRETDGTERALDGAGLLAAMEDLTRQEIAESDLRLLCEGGLGSLATQLPSREIISTQSLSILSCPGPYNLDLDADIATGFPPTHAAAWWPWTVCAAAWLMMGFTVHFSAKATMGTKMIAASPES